MLTVRVLYFAVLRELVGMSEQSLELPPDRATIADVFKILEEQHESLRGKLGRVRAAKKQTFANLGDTVENNDELALIPPVAGG